jgi:cytochrome bd ubiquinol oxidase subunit I
MRTANSVSPSLTGTDVLLSLIGYVVVYLIMFPAGFYMMRRVVRAGPAATAERPPVESGRPEGPVTALPRTAP